MSFYSRIGTLLIAVLALLTLLTSAARAADVAAEHAIKAAVATKITKFGCWPEGALGDDGEPLRFCVAQSTEFHAALQEFEDYSIGGRPMNVALVDDPDRVPDSCDVLYLSGIDSAETDAWLSHVETRPILTFGETTDTSIVTISIRRKKVRFSINLEASERAGLDIGAQLLQLAALTNRR
jgi:hypothetical protein